tara:strand:- start:1435 stop:1887 length:453 start_codon:yes stop_codon:yes gene_type:complete
MKETTKKTLVTGVSVLLLTAGLFFVGRVIVQRLKGRNEDDASTLLEGEEGSGDTQLTPSEESEAKNYNPATDAKYINDRISGWKVPFVYYDEEVNGLIAKLTDAKLKKMANYYKTKYKKSLYLALDEEWDYYSGNQYKGSMNRLSSLGLR